MPAYGKKDPNNWANNNLLTIQWHKMSMPISSNIMNNRGFRQSMSKGELTKPYSFSRIYPKFYRSPILDQGKVLSSSPTTSGIPSPRTETEEISVAFDGEKKKEMILINRDEAESNKKMLAEMAEQMIKVNQMKGQWHTF